MRWKFWLSSKAPRELIPSVIDAPETLFCPKRNIPLHRVKRQIAKDFLLAPEC